MTATINRCARGSRCHAAERDGDQLVGTASDRPLCNACEQTAARALADAPALYVQLRNALMPGAAIRGEMVKASRGAPLPLNAQPLHLSEQLHWLLTSWEDVVREIAGLVDAHRVGQREGAQVQAAARTLSAHLSAWISAPSTGFSPDRWTPEFDQTGAQAVCALLEWRQRVRMLPGLDTAAPKAVRRYEQRCPACGVRAITHRAGDDLMQCQSCWATHEYMPTLPREADYQLQEAG